MKNDPLAVLCAAVLCFYLTTLSVIFTNAPY